MCRTSIISKSKYQFVSLARSRSRCGIFVRTGNPQIDTENPSLGNWGKVHKFLRRLNKNGSEPRQFGIHLTSLTPNPFETAHDLTLNTKFTRNTSAKINLFIYLYNFHVSVLNSNEIRGPSHRGRQKFDCGLENLS